MTSCYPPSFLILWIYDALTIININISTIHVTIQYPAHLNQQYGPRCASDTLTDTHEQYIFNTARQVVSLFLSTYQASLMYSTSTGNTWFSHYDPGITRRAVTTNQEPVTTLLPPSTTTRHTPSQKLPQFIHSTI